MGTLILSLIFASVVWIYHRQYTPNETGLSYLIGKSVIELIFNIFAFPLYIARLRDLGWSPYLAILFLIGWLFQTRNVVIYMLLNGIESWEGFGSIILEGATSLVVAVLLGCMLLIKSTPNKSLNQDAPNRHAC